MCMKYINANVQCFKATTNPFCNQPGFSEIISSIQSIEEENEFIIGGFNIVTFLNIRGTAKGDNPNNPLDAKRKLHFCIRLTKLDSDPNNRLSYDIREFKLDLSDNRNVRKACFEYMERIEVTKVNKILLKSKGEYVIKVLVKEENSDLYDIQMVHPLTVE